METFTADIRGIKERKGVVITGGKEIEFSAPKMFGGNESKLCPEELLTASIGACYALTFEAFLNKFRIEVEDFYCHVETVIERKEKGYRFTKARIDVEVKAKNETKDKVIIAVEKAKKYCFITNAFNFDVEMNYNVEGV